MSRWLTLLALSSTVITQQTAVDILIPGLDPDYLAASVVGVKSDITTYILECTSREECSTFTAPTITQGSTLFSMVTATSETDRSA